MHCPREDTTLVVREAEGHIGYFCSSCKGTWLPTRYVQSIEYTRQFSYADFPSNIAENSVVTSELACPSGCGRLHEVKSPDASLFWCPKCRGAWFDRGEIARLLAEFAPRESGAAEFLAKQAAWGLVASILASLLP